MNSRGLTHMSNLADALFSETKQKVLSLLYRNPEKSFYINEIIRATGMGVATIKRELDRLEEAGILQKQRIGNQHHYQVEPLCPIYKELKSIVIKTSGYVDVIAEGLASLQSRIEKAFIFGSLARGTENSGSDIDLMIIGDVSLEEVVEVLYPIQTSFGRYINPKIYSPSEWTELVAEQGEFIKDVMINPRLDVIGSSNEPG